MVDSKTYGRRRRAAAIACLSLLCLAATALAQREFGDFGRGRLQIQKNIPYDGRFTFVRISYETPPAATGRRAPVVVARLSAAEQNPAKIMNELSYLGAHDEEINTLTLDDPALASTRWPNHRSRLVDAERSRSGGLARLHHERRVASSTISRRHWRGIEGGGWEPFAENMKRVLPEARFVEMQ